MQRDASPTAAPMSDANPRRLSLAPSVPGWWIGPLLTVAAGLLIVLTRELVPISSPELILMVFVALSAVLAGVVPALASAAIVAVFAIVDSSAPGQPFVYDSAALSRLVVDVAAAISMALLVGGNRQRLRAQREPLAGQSSDERQQATSGAVREAPAEAMTATADLPRDDDPVEVVRTGEPLSPPRSQPGHETILVAEDEAVVRDMVVAALERNGYHVVAASTGEEAVRLIDRMGEEIDLLLSDVVMPGMSGPDLYDRARRTRPDLKAVFMSGYTALAIGRPIPDGITLLEKPFSGARLNEVVRETLAAR